jgi:transcriptional regulator with XRE-family HTH domain
VDVTNLQILRESRGLTQREQADKLAISVATYAPIERGSMKPSVRVCELLEAEFGFAVAVLLQPVLLPAQPPSEPPKGKASHE